MKQISTALLVWACLAGMYAQTTSTFTGSNTTIDDDIIFDAAGNFYGSSYDSSKVFKITPDGQESIFVSGLGSPNGMAFYDDGSMVLADNTGNKIYKVSPDGTKQVLVSSVSGPSGILRIPGTDTMLVTSYTTHVIWKLSVDGALTLYKSHPEFNGPVGMCYDENHNLYVANFNNRKIFKITPDGQVSFLTQPPLGQYIGFIAYRNGFIYATAMNAHRIYKIDLNGNYAVWMGSTVGSTDGDISVTQFFRPNGIRFSPSGDTLYVSEYGAKRVRMIVQLDGVSNTSPVLMPVWNLKATPNPSLHDIHITFDLPVSTQLILDLSDLQGNVQALILPEDTYAAGHYKFLLTRNNIAPGVYFLRMQSADGRMIAHKIVFH
ncbi:MAG: NHL repeat-containing protein [Saprospiraceae bacterium]|nr:NHL repeat-containing protein [Saprospiraceae bacterium]